MNTAPAQVHAIFSGKEAFGRLKVHGLMELLKPLLVKRDNSGNVYNKFFSNFHAPYSGNTATMIYTDYYISSWTPYKGKWVATLNGTKISVNFEGAVKSIISLNEQVGLEGYQIR
jgi:hypothetical protein